MIPHNWDMSFQKFGGPPTVVVFEKIKFWSRDTLFLAATKQL